MAEKIDSNVTGLSYAEELTLGVLPGALGADAVWYEAEPNSYGDFGGEIETVARAPINASRQRKKGTTVDVNASVGIQLDFTQRQSLRPLQSFFFAKAREKAETQPLNAAKIVVTGATATTFTAAAGLAAFLPGHLVLSQGFALAANNRLALVSAAVAATLTVGAGGAVEGAPPAAARVTAVGFQFAVGDATLAATASALTLASAAVNLTTLGLTVGEWVFIGGDTVPMQFSDGRIGYARVKSIAAGAVTFDQSTFAAAADTGVGKTIQIFFGKFLRNELTPSLIVRKTLQFERTLGSDEVGPQAEYVRGCVGNEFSLNLATASKLEAEMNFVGIDNEQRTGTEGPKVGAHVAAPVDEAFNTSSNVYRAFIGVVDPAVMNSAALFGYAQDATLTINNNANPNKAIGVLGAFEVSVGDFEVGGEVNAYFSTVAAIRAVRNNDSLNYNVICAKQNAGFVFDVPLLTAGGGSPTVEKDAPIMVPLEIMGAQNTAGYTLSYTHFDYLPTIAMPVND